LGSLENKDRKKKKYKKKDGLSLPLNQLMVVLIRGRALPRALLK
jgi:hypothetical protein